jgi:retron-type reverse transcriptase
MASARIKTRRLTKSTRGIPQGGVISPLLSNIYLHPVGKYWELKGLDERSSLDAKLIR